VAPLLARLFENPAARDQTWDFMRSRWDALSPRIPAGLASRLVGALAALRTPERRAEIVAFFEAHPVPSAARALRQTLERLDLDARLRAHLAPQLASFLASAAPDHE
jgi:puromycin-sensitive aminopeptidase